jgi:hypothetical protein
MTLRGAGLPRPLRYGGAEQGHWPEFLVVPLFQPRKKREQELPAVDQLDSPASVAAHLPPRRAFVGREGCHNVALAASLTEYRSNVDGLAKGGLPKEGPPFSNRGSVSGPQKYLARHLRGSGFAGAFLREPADPTAQKRRHLRELL